MPKQLPNGNLPAKIRAAKLETVTGYGITGGKKLVLAQYRGFIYI